MATSAILSTEATPARPSWHTVGHRLGDVFRAAGEALEAETTLPAKTCEAKCVEASPAPSSIFPSTCPGSESDGEDLSDAEYDCAPKGPLLLVVSESDAEQTAEQRARENARWRAVGRRCAAVFQALAEEDEEL